MDRVHNRPLTFFEFFDSYEIIDDCLHVIDYFFLLLGVICREIKGVILSRDFKNILKIFSVCYTIYKTLFIEFKVIDLVLFLFLLIETTE